MSDRRWMDGWTGGPSPCLLVLVQVSDPGTSDPDAPPTVGGLALFYLVLAV